MASLSQVQALLSSGVEPTIARNLSRDAALQAITDIDKSNRILAATQRELF